MRSQPLENDSSRARYGVADMITNATVWLSSLVQVDVTFTGDACPLPLGCMGLHQQAVAPVVGELQRKSKALPGAGVVSPNDSLTVQASITVFNMEQSPRNHRGAPNPAWRERLGLLRHEKTLYYCTLIDGALCELLFRTTRQRLRFR